MNYQRGTTSTHLAKNSRAIPVQNRFADLDDIGDGSKEVTSNICDCGKNVLRLSSGKKSIRSIKKKIEILGDSHARDLSGIVLESVKDLFSVSGFVQSGAPIKNILTSTPFELNSLTKDDYLVIYGGANDVARNNSENALSSLNAFLPHVGHTNVICLPVPQRYDLMANSCVNQLITSHNRKFGKICKQFSHVKMVEPNLDRSHFTTHGQHLNFKGKEAVSKTLCNLFTKTETDVINNSVSEAILGYWPLLSNGKDIFSKERQKVKSENTPFLGEIQEKIETK